MAKATWRMPDDFLMKVSRLADKTDEILPKVLEAGAEVVEDKVRSNLQAVIGSGTKYESRSTGELLRSLGTSPALQDKNGDFNVKVGFSEPRSDGDSNAKIATILEYGKSGQPAKPFLKPAQSSSRNGLPVETGVFSDEPPGEYVVVTPLADTYELHADNLPGYETQEARLSLFSKGNYLKRKGQLSNALLAADFVITDRRYIGHEDDTGYHHYAIDVAKLYGLEE